ISQMFGELIGLWCVAVWRAMGSPRPLLLVELGPGRGTLMADALRAARVAPDFLGAIDLHFVETSEVLAASQRVALQESGAAAKWHKTAEAVPAGGAGILANEFFDCLPVRQFVRGTDGWHERLVGLNGAEHLCFGLALDPEPGIAASGEADLTAHVDFGGLAQAARAAGARAHGPVPQGEWLARLGIYERAAKLR